MQRGDYYHVYIFHAADPLSIFSKAMEGFMVLCDGCSEWFHGFCLGVSKAVADKNERYLCPACAVRVQVRLGSS